MMDLMNFESVKSKFCNEPQMNTDKHGQNNDLKFSLSYPADEIQSLIYLYKLVLVKTGMGQVLDARSKKPEVLSLTSYLLFFIGLRLRLARACVAS